MSEIKVLLVDDEVGFTASMKKVLSRRGFDVKVAADGLTALSLIAREHFDVVVLDIKMPGMDGIQVLWEIKRLTPDIQCHPAHRTLLLVRGRRYFEEGAYACLLKPCPISEVVDLIVAAASNSEDST